MSPKAAQIRITREASADEDNKTEVGEKRGDPDTETKAEEKSEPPTKKTKAETSYQTGVIERGHVYFFYRPKVELEEAHDLSDVKNTHLVLVPRPPAFASEIVQDNGDSAIKPESKEEGEMKVLQPGADAIPAPATRDEERKHFRVITVGKKQLPDPSSGGPGRGRRETFWACVTSVSDDLKKLADAFGPQEYETKTRGTRHNAAARLCARGVYAIVNNDPPVPSKKSTHLAYALTHPNEKDIGDIQRELGLHQTEASFRVQVKNPDAPAPGRTGLPPYRRANFPEEIMETVFGKGGGKGRESYGLRFAACERADLLDYEGTELLLIGAHSGRDGVDQSLGAARGTALDTEAEEEKDELTDDVFRELQLDKQKFRPDPLEGHWI